jgi:hypothetical protein
MHVTKSTWVTRRIAAPLSWKPAADPVIGDVLLCQVLSPSLHGRVETADGSRAKLYPGDRIACVVGNRYATSLLEGIGEVDGPNSDLLSASGVCGRCVGRSEKASRPTGLRVLGQAFLGGEPLNVRSFALPSPPAPSVEPAWVVVVGSAMDSGKTTACTSLIHGLAAAGYRVGAAKLSGTASARDWCSFRDAGAVPVLDFLDVGWPSTAGCSEEQLHAIVAGLVGHLRTASVDVAVVEIADGLLQTETNALISLLGGHLGSFRTVLTARESLAAVAGVERLARAGHDVVAVSGVLTNSHLAAREVELDTGVPCIATALLGEAISDAVTAVGPSRDVSAEAIVA